MDMRSSPSNKIQDWTNGSLTRGGNSGGGLLQVLFQKRCFTVCFEAEDGDKQWLRCNCCSSAAAAAVDGTDFDNQVGKLYLVAEKGAFRRNGVEYAKMFPAFVHIGSIFGPSSPSLATCVLDRNKCARLILSDVAYRNACRLTGDLFSCFQNFF